MSCHEFSSLCKLYYYKSYELHATAIELNIDTTPLTSVTELAYNVKMCFLPCTEYTHVTQQNFYILTTLQIMQLINLCSARSS